MIAQLIADLNKGTMATAEAVARYARNTEVWPPERVIWDRLRVEVAQRPILDLGMGGGRTVPALTSLSKDYTGLDYTPAMVKVCQHKFPHLRFEHGDARDLSRFQPGRFGLVVFSCNGIGMVNHEDRLRILAEVHRVLQPGGFFAFSAQNQNGPDCRAGLVLADFEPAKNPLRTGVRLLRFVRHCLIRYRNFRRYARHDLHTEEYSLINDRCHDYATMAYYIGPRSQRAQLVRAGFRPEVDAYDLAGRPAADDATDVAIYYLARK